MKSLKASGGFSIPELLLVILIFSIIATFTIPKVITASQNNQREAVFKETIAALDSVFYQGYLTQEIGVQEQSIAYFKKHLNVVKFCNSDSYNEGCWQHNAGSFDSWRSNHAGAVMHSGATILSFYVDNTCCAGAIRWVVYIDWNGAKSPNLAGDDQMVLSAYTHAGPIPGVILGVIKPNSSLASGGVSQTLYYSIFN